MELDWQRSAAAVCNPQYTASAHWAGNPESGACDDGYGDPALPATGFYTAAKRRRVLTTRSRRFRRLNRNITYTSPSLSAGNAGSEAVNITVTPAPISLTLTGPVLSGTTNYLAVGQELLAQVNGLNGGQDTYTWTVPSAGSPFGELQPVHYKLFGSNSQSPTPPTSKRSA